ncbi:unnamed protein product, partial [Allacma fusca]
VFSSDEMTTSPPNNGTQNNATTTATITNSASITTPVSNNSIDVVQSVKKQRQKNSSPNRQGPQRCVVSNYFILSFSYNSNKCNVSGSHYSV